MAGQHIAKTQTWPVSIQLKKAGQQKASWPVSIKHFFAKHQLTLLLGRSQHVDPLLANNKEDPLLLQIEENLKRNRQVICHLLEEKATTIN